MSTCFLKYIANSFQNPMNPMKMAYRGAKAHLQAAELQKNNSNLLAAVFSQRAFFPPNVLSPVIYNTSLYFKLLLPMPARLSVWLH